MRCRRGLAGDRGRGRIENGRRAFLRPFRIMRKRSESCEREWKKRPWLVSPQLHRAPRSGLTLGMGLVAAQCRSEAWPRFVQSVHVWADEAQGHRDHSAERE